MGFSAVILETTLEVRDVEWPPKAMGLCQVTGSDSLFASPAGRMLPVSLFVEIESGLRKLRLFGWAMSSNRLSSAISLVRGSKIMLGNPWSA